MTTRITHTLAILTILITPGYSGHGYASGYGGYDGGHHGGHGTHHKGYGAGHHGGHGNAYYAGYGGHHHSGHHGNYGHYGGHHGGVVPAGGGLDSGSQVTCYSPRLQIKSDISNSAAGLVTESQEAIIANEETITANDQTADMKESLIENDHSGFAKVKHNTMKQQTDVANKKIAATKYNAAALKSHAHHGGYGGAYGGSSGGEYGAIYGQGLCNHYHYKQTDIETTLNDETSTNDQMTAVKESSTGNEESDFVNVNFNANKQQTDVVPLKPQQRPKHVEAFIAQSKDTDKDIGDYGEHKPIFINQQNEFADKKNAYGSQNNAKIPQNGFTFQQSVAASQKSSQDNEQTTNSAPQRVITTQQFIYSNQGNDVASDKNIQAAQMTQVIQTTSTVQTANTTRTSIAVETSRDQIASAAQTSTAQTTNAAQTASAVQTESVAQTGQKVQTQSTTQDVTSKKSGESVEDNGHESHDGYHHGHRGYKRHIGFGRQRRSEYEHMNVIKL